MGLLKKETELILMEKIIRCKNCNGFADLSYSKKEDILDKSMNLCNKCYIKTEEFGSKAKKVKFIIECTIDAEHTDIPELWDYFENYLEYLKPMKTYSVNLKLIE